MLLCINSDLWWSQTSANKSDYYSTVKTILHTAMPETWCSEQLQTSTTLLAKKNLVAHIIVNRSLWAKSLQKGLKPYPTLLAVQNISGMILQMLHLLGNA